MFATLLDNILHRINAFRGLFFGLMIITALLAFEVFNYSTTEFALDDVLGDLRFFGVGWATILAIAFCFIDFAGIARLFTPEKGPEEPTEIWYLFGAWLVAATMNAMLTWWGVSLAVLGHDTLGNSIVDRSVLIRIVPIFVAVMVWLIRVLIIGTFSLAGERLFTQSEGRTIVFNPRKLGITTALKTKDRARPIPDSTVSQRTIPSFNPAPKPGSLPRSEPNYHPLSMSLSESYPNSSVNSGQRNMF